MTPAALHQARIYDWQWTSGPALNDPVDWDPYGCVFINELAAEACVRSLGDDPLLGAMWRFRAARRGRMWRIERRERR